MVIKTNSQIPKKPFLLACKICEQGNPSIAYDLIQNLKDDVEKLIDLKAFIVDNKGWIEDVNGNYQEIIYQNGKALYFDRNKELIEIHNNFVTIYKVNFNWLINSIRNNLEITKYPSEVIINDLFWRIGTFEEKIPIFFTRRLGNRTVLENIYKSLIDRKGINKGVILTSSSNVPFGCSRLLGHEVLSLNDCLIHDSKNFHIDRNILKAAIGIRLKQDGFSNGYRTAYFNNIEYRFTKKQAAIIEALDKSGGVVNKYELLAEADSDQYDVYRIFRDSRGNYHPAWNFIIKNDGKGSYWLQLS